MLPCGKHRLKKGYFFQKSHFFFKIQFFISRATPGTTARIIMISIILGIISVYATKMRIEGILKNISLSKSLITGNNLFPLNIGTI